MKELCFGQRIDPTNNLLEPWLTNPAMDEIKTWDLKNKKVLEYGAGASTLWWADKCAAVKSVEANYEWTLSIYHNALNQGYQGKGEINRHTTYFHLNAAGKQIQLLFRECNEGDQSKIAYYVGLPEGYRPDIVVVDGILRYECILKALTLPRPLTLIVDNWQQDYVFICPAAEDALRDYEGQIFIQPDHTNHEGKPWATAIWHLS